MLIKNSFSNACKIQKIQKFETKYYRKNLQQKINIYPNPHGIFPACFSTYSAWQKVIYDL